VRELGAPARIGDVARRLAGATFRFRSPRQTPVLLVGYLDDC